MSLIPTLEKEKKFRGQVYLAGCITNLATLATYLVKQDAVMGQADRYDVGILAGVGMMVYARFKDLQNDLGKAKLVEAHEAVNYLGLPREKEQYTQLADTFATNQTKAYQGAKKGLAILGGCIVTSFGISAVQDPSTWLTAVQTVAVLVSGYSFGKALFGSAEEKNMKEAEAGLTKLSADVLRRNRPAPSDASPKAPAM